MCIIERKDKYETFEFLEAVTRKKSVDIDRSRRGPMLQTALSGETDGNFR